MITFFFKLFITKHVILFNIITAEILDAQRIFANISCAALYASRAVFVLNHILGGN